MLKRTMSIVVVFVSMLVMSICYASVSNDEISIGGVYYHASANYVTSVYGNPDKITTTTRHPLWSGRVDTYYYGNSFKVDIRNGIVMHIDSKGNNGLGTPAGITVGMDESTLIDLYGNGRTSRNKHGDIISHYYDSDSNSYVGLKFNINNGIITEINAGAFD